MNFASSYYALALLVLPMLILLKMWADKRAQISVAAFATSERLRSPLLAGASLVWSWTIFSLQLLGLALIIIALTRPQYGIIKSEVPLSGRNVFIAIDTSKSMLADDMAPNRLTRAKLAALDLLEKIPGDRVGLIAFAGRAFLQAPLTTDHEAMRESIQALDHTTIPRGGSSLASAINLVLEITEKTPSQRCGLILFSDGQETDDGTLAAAKDAASKKLLILPVGMGTAEGSLIPDPDPERQGDYVRDENGNVVKARLQSELLQQVATITGASYIELASQALTQNAIDSLLTQLDAKTSESRVDSRPIERYQWPLGLGLLCIILSQLMRHATRKPIKTPALPIDPQTAVHVPSASTLAALTLFGLLALHGPAHAREVNDLKRATEAYAQGKFEEARDIYSRALKQKVTPPHANQMLYGLAASEHQLKDYDGAIQSYSKALEFPDQGVQSQALRGLGTSLYDLGDSRLQKEPEFTIKAWTDSRDHFTNALNALQRLNKENTPEYKEIEENRDFVQKRLDELKKQQEQQKQKEKSKDKQQKGDKGEGEPDENGESGKDQDQQQKEGDNSKQKESDQLQKMQEQLPEGDLKAKEGGQQQGERKDLADDQRNDKTGFTPQEARNQLRTYADDQKSAQYMMRREKPPGGKDY
ncbi:MAG: VWA domain-containing protein [Verrucomicrobia bacterium]|nr:VWA domain-containing protein [Verrucomicrobiota bacterium]